MNQENLTRKLPPLTSEHAIGVVALCDWVKADEVRSRARKYATYCNSSIKTGRFLGAQVDRYSAGTERQKMHDLRIALCDPEVRVIISATGGYSVLFLLTKYGNQILEEFRKNPKLIVGYSDNDLFGNWLQHKLNIPSVCGPSMWGMYGWDSHTRKHLKDLITGNQEKYVLNHDTKWQAIRNGVATGVLVTSNFGTLKDSIYSGFNPLSSINDPVILAIEEFGVYKDDLNHDLHAFFANPESRKVSGVIFGRSPGIEAGPYPAFAKKHSLEDILKRQIPRHIPVAVLDDFGHGEWGGTMKEGYKTYAASNKRFLAIPRGVWAELSVGKSTTLVYDSPVWLSR